MRRCWPAAAVVWCAAAVLPPTSASVDLGTNLPALHYLSTPTSGKRNDATATRVFKDLMKVASSFEERSCCGDDAGIVKVCTHAKARLAAFRTDLSLLSLSLCVCVCVCVCVCLSVCLSAQGTFVGASTEAQEYLPYIERHRVLPFASCA